MIASPLHDSELIVYILNGLFQDSPISFKELYVKLTEHEAFLKRTNSRTKDAIIASHFANHHVGMDSSPFSPFKKNNSFGSHFSNGSLSPHRDQSALDSHPTTKGAVSYALNNPLVPFISLTMDLYSLSSPIYSSSSFSSCFLH